MTMLRTGSIALVLVGALFAGCAAPLGDPDVDPDLALSQEELRCSSGCCGSEFNCRVPDPERRDGCGGARIRNPATGSCDWAIRAGADRTMFDGLGTPIGEVRASAVRLNQGIRKHLGGRWLVYAFATQIRATDGTLQHASGWIEQASLVHADRLHGYTLALESPGEGDYEARWRIVTAGRERFVDRFLRSPSGERYPATDYLVRPFGLLHLTYTVPGFDLGGHATDSFPPGTVFRRSRGVPQITIPLYGPAGHRSELSLHFVYGWVNDGEQRRYGWIAREALEQIPEAPPPPPPAPGASCDVRCCDGALVTGVAAGEAGACVSASSPICEDHGYVLRARWGGAVAYERDSFCWAKCANREAYHRVEGVTSGCTDAARAFCATGDRGALEDAMWDPCQPR